LNPEGGEISPLRGSTGQKNSNVYNHNSLSGFS
jgi:hypothetical protein